MKHVFATIFLTVSTVCQGQVQMTYENGAIIQTVIDVESTPAPDLYKLVSRWVTKTYKNPDKVVKASLENEEIRGDGFEAKGLLINQTPKIYNDFRYSFKIEVKDNRVRYTMYDMRGELYEIEAYCYKKDGTFRTNSQATTVKNSATAIAAALIQSLANALLNKEKADDW